ncbi:hypothetical protein [Aeromonas australiensis]|uniref:hypothetical protein n=1 Tax=Aeromonas australiensis TaxID=1114880 RepID=UPI000589CC2D|nr:hypothetical protein [Aeromonas australiensis]
MSEFIIWLQLISALVLLSDAYLSENVRALLDEKLKSSVGEYSKTYKEKYLKRDLSLLLAIVIAWIAFLVFGQAGQLIAPASNWIEHYFGVSYIGLVLLVLWALGFMYLFSIAMSGFHHLDRMLHLTVSFPLALALYNAPKGPLYAIGFGLLVISHLLQLVQVNGI